jgi:hypothetical protein
VVGVAAEALAGGVAEGGGVTWTLAEEEAVAEGFDGGGAPPAHAPIATFVPVSARRKERARAR